MNKENLIVPLKYLELHPIQKGMVGIYQGMIEPEYEILDLACGHKVLTRYLKCKKFVGIDIFPDYLTKFDVEGDIRKLDKLFEPKSFDCLFILDAIEHIEKEEGYKLIKDSEKIARRKIIIFTPTKWTKNEDGVKNYRHWSYGNKYNYHQSLWTEKDFLDLGFTRMKTVYDEDYLIVVKEVPRTLKKEVQK